MVEAYVVRSYLDAGKNLTLIRKGSSRPMLDEWTEKIVPEKKIMKHLKRGGNLGWQIGPEDLVIDVDPRNKGDKAYKLLKKHLKIDFEPNVKTPRGGFHIYLKIPKKYRGVKLKTKLRQYEGLDFLHQGHQCVIPTSERPDGKYTWYDDFRAEFSQSKAPKALLDLLIKGNKVNKPSTVQSIGKNSKDFDALEASIGSSGSDWSLEKVMDMLEAIPKNIEYHDWLNVGMALHDWHPQDGLEIWDKWSKKDKKRYEKGLCKKKWSGFTVGDGVTLGTLAYLAKSAIFDDEHKEVKKYVNKIQFADEKTLRFEIAKDIQKGTFGDLNREILVQAIKNRLKILTKTTLPIAKIRKMVEPQIVVKGNFVEEGEKPRWAKRWVYVSTHTAFMNLIDRTLHKTEGFNLECGKYIPPNEKGNKISAIKYVSDNGFMSKVHTVAYLPMIEDPIAEVQGRRVANTFNIKTVPEAAEDFTKGGKRAIERLKRHFKLICTTDEDTDILIKWIAHNIQYMGVKINWGPCIQSIQGTGKTFLGDLITELLGLANVNVVSPTQVASQFNGWANGACVNVLQELRIVGHNRYDVVNALKPLMTDKVIMVNPKGVQQYQTINTTNYIATTNFKDAIPLDDDDRRWWIIFMPIEHKDDFFKLTGQIHSEYFTKLFAAIEDYADEIKLWFQKIDLTEFKKIKEAPMTVHKMSMIATEKTGLTGLVEMKRVIEEGSKFFNTECISSSDLFNHMLISDTDFNASARDKNIILKRLGYTLLPNRVKIGGTPKQIWTKRPMTNKEVRKSLKLSGTKRIEHKK